jgi:hypothetical protein
MCTILFGVEGVQTITLYTYEATCWSTYYSVCAVLVEYGWYRYYMLVHSDFFCLFLLFIPLCVVLKGSKPLPFIRTKLHAELHTTLCMQSWQIIVGTGTTCWCVYFYLLTPLCVMLKGSKPLPSIRTKLHAELHTTLCVQSWQSMAGTGTTCWCVVCFCFYFHLFIPLCVVLKGSKPLPSIRTKLHAELHTTLCMQSWQIIVWTRTTCLYVVCFWFNFYLIYYYVWCWRGTNHYSTYKLSYMLSYILFCVCSHGRVWLVPVLNVGA